MALDYCDLVWKLRSRFFAKDRDITLQSDRVLVLGDGTEIPSSALVPVGGIILWSGSVASIPANWQICDGTNSTPDLRDRFVVGAGSSYAVDATGGAAAIDIQHNHASGSLTTANDTHNHGIGTIATGIDIHSHGPGTLATGTNNAAQVVQSGTGVSVAANPHGHTVTSGLTDTDTHNHTTAGNTANDTHNHSVSGNTGNALSTTQSILNPYYSLAFIQRMS